MACFRDDLDACIGHLRPSVAHRRLRRTTNVLERLFCEERRRTKTIPHAFGERTVMNQMFAALTRASCSWRGIPISDFERRQLNALREELNAKFNERHASARLTTAPRSRNFSNSGT
jgi:putative transposase